MVEFGTAEGILIHSCFKKPVSRMACWSLVMSYGIVPWVKINNTFFVLGQVSVSAFKCDIKVDPFRGKPKDGETRWATAARELWEESAHLLDLRQLRVDHPSHAGLFQHPSDNGLFHLSLQFSTTDEFSQFVSQYDRNSAKLGNEKQECLGIAFVPADYQGKTLPDNTIRLANQMLDVLRQTRVMLKEGSKLPSLHLKMTQENECVSWIPAAADEQLNITDIGAVASLDVSLPKNWQYSQVGASNEAELNREFVFRGIVNVLQTYPDSWRDIAASPGYRQIERFPELLTKVNCAIQAAKNQEAEVEHKGEMVPFLLLKPTTFSHALTR